MTAKERRTSSLSEPCQDQVPFPEYLCRHCGETWETEKPGPQICQRCGSLAITWWNYDAWKRAYGPTPCLVASKS